MSTNFPNRLILVTFLVSALFSVPYQMAGAQDSAVALPRVAQASVPLYPPLARVAHVEGMIHVTVTTDGHRVVSSKAIDGPKILAMAAEENARTWRFAIHEPTAFTVTYKYRLVPGLKGDPDNPVVVMRLPTEVEVSISPWPQAGDPSPDSR